MDFKGFFSNWFVKNLLIAAIAVLALVFASNFLLKIGTHHGQEIEVPDFANMSVADAGHIAAESGIRIIVTGTRPCFRAVPEGRQQGEARQADQADHQFGSSQEGYHAGSRRIFNAPGQG